VAGKNDVVVLDRLAHASMVDGAKLSGAQVRVFRHNDADHLDRVLTRHDGTGLALVCVEGIYSMDGDMAPLNEICRVVRKHNAMLMVDEAHSTGVLGPDGRGAVAHFGLVDEVDLHVGTMSKALGATGGFVAASRPIVTYIRYFARSGMFSTAPSPMTMAAANAALDVIRAEPQRRETLWDNCRYLHSNLKQMGFKINDAPSPIIPVVVGTMKALRQMTLELHAQDICVNSVPFPAVPHGSERLRISLTANHTQPQLARALACICRAGKNAGII
jgi:glycine C-acetyltransferase